MYAVLVKDTCMVTLLDTKDKLEGMIDKFVEKDEMTLTNLFLALEDTIFFNVETETIAKGL